MAIVQERRVYENKGIQVKKASSKEYVLVKNTIQSGLNLYGYLREQRSADEQSLCK